MERRVLIEEPPRSKEADEEEGEEGGGRIRTELSKNTETQEPFMGIKARRRSSVYTQFHGDYLNVPSNQQIIKVVTKQGDRQVLFADSIVKVNRDGVIRRRILVITNVAFYTLDSRWYNLKRRIALSAIQGLCLSEFSDNFFAVIVPTEYDCLLASTRKSEVVTVLVEAMKNISHNSFDVFFGNSFEYRVDSHTSKIVQFEEVDGVVKTRITKK